MRRELFIVIVLTILDLGKKVINLLFPDNQSEGKNEDG
jgi:hypothetical protein